MDHARFSLGTVIMDQDSRLVMGHRVPSSYVLLPRYYTLYLSLILILNKN